MLAHTPSSIVSFEGKWGIFALYVFYSSPFNVSDGGGERLREDKRWKYGVPAVGNANVVWMQHSR